LVGAVDSNLHVAAIKQDHQMNNLGASIAPCQSHGNLMTRKMLHGQNRNLNASTSIYWRYRSDVNELLWCDWPSEKQTQYTVEYLKTLGITNPRGSYDQYASQKNISEFHNLKYEYKNSKVLYQEGVNDKNFIVTGRVSDDLDVVGRKYTGRDDVITHAMLRGAAGEVGGFIDWRYRADENRVYYLDREPTSEQKDTISYFLKNKFGVTVRPAFVFLRISDKPKAHYPHLSANYKHPPFENTIIENMEKIDTEHYL